MSKNTQDMLSLESIEEIEKLNARLQKSNNELLQYAHVASHDLQEPLRKIQIFSSMLDQSKTMCDSDHELVKKILTSSQRMRLLITDLLAYSRVNGPGKMFRPVNLNDVAANVMEDFELAIMESHAVIRVGQLPKIDGLALELNQLFYNLIDNAFKFSDPSRIPEISISCNQLNEAEIATFFAKPYRDKIYYDITFKDNGIGFDVRYAEQIYNVFKRLHPKESYTGSGIGLSLCRSIVSNHDGTLYVKSQPGEGSEFHIIIPE